MNRSERIPQVLIDYLMQDMESWLRNLLSVGYPLAIDKGYYLFPIYLTLTDKEEHIPLLHITGQFEKRGALCYDITANHNSSFTSIVFYIKAVQQLGAIENGSVAVQSNA